jgi:ketosteroid isomerase-like protein
VSAGIESRKSRIKAILTAYGEGDMGALREALDPGIVYHSHAPSELFRWGGRHEGQVNGLAVLSALASDYAVHRYEVKEIVGEGDVVWVRADLEATDRHRKIRVETQLATRWEFKGDHVIRVDEYYDTAAVALKQGLVTLKASGS